MIKKPKKDEKLQQCGHDAPGEELG